MKFGDILGEMHLNEELSEHYKKVAHKVKLMYKTLRTGGFKIDKLIPNMVPFWTGFEMIEDGDALITYELPTKYHLTSGNEAISYELIITGITINCEKYPGLADDIDVREDILRKLARKLNNALKGTFDEGEQVKIQLRRKHTVPSAYENMIDESVVGSEDEYLIKKIKLAFKVLRKGKADFDHPFYNTQTKSIQHRNVDFKYELPNHIRIHKNSGDTLNPFTIQVPEFKIESEKYSTLQKNSEIRQKVLRIIADKLNKIVGTSIGAEQRINIVFEKPHHNKNLTTPITIRESIVNNPQEQEQIIKKSKLVYKSFRKGKVKVTLPPVFNDGQEIEVVAKYELPTKFKIRLDFKQVFMRSVTIFLPIDSIKFEFDYESKNKAIENELLEQLRHKIKMKFVHFDSNCDLIFTKYPDAFRNADDHVVKEEESKYDHLIKKAPTVFKALKKGKISMNIDFLSDWRSQTEKKYTFDYDLGNVYIVETDPFENNYNVKILIPAIKISCDENPDLNNNQRIKMDILDKIKQKFQQFGLNVIQRATKFHLKHNGTWVKL